MSYQPVRKDARVLVTGASTGIGEATVRLLCREGWNVIAVARRQDRLIALSEETGCQWYACDLRDRQAVEKMGHDIERTGRVTSLVVNAGGALGADSVAQGDVEDWKAMYDRNVVTALNTVQVFLPSLRQSGGDIVFITSTAATETYCGGAGYTAAKHAEAMIARTLRLELVGEDVRLVEICPGMVKTPEFSLNRLGDAARAEAVYEGVENPLYAQDIADIVGFALSRPAHVNLDQIIVRPIAQATSSIVARHSGL